MIIANSVFDSIHKRPAHIYNRASVELLIAILFDRKFAIPTASLLDSKLLHEIVGPFLVAAEKYNHQFAKPIVLYVDPVRHFKRAEHQHVVFDAAEAYLSGRAQTGRDLASENSDHYPLAHRFAMIAAEQVEGEKRNVILRGLRERHNSIFHSFSEYFQMNAPIFNKYFQENPDHILEINNIFSEKSYEIRLKEKMMTYLEVLERDGIGSFRREWDKVEEILKARDAFTRNQVLIEGEKFISDWNRVFLPFINYNYWNLLSEVCRASYSLNLEMGDDVDVQIVQAIAETERSPSQQFNSQLHFTKSHDPHDLDGAGSPYRVPIDWTPVLKVRNSDVANKYHEVRANENSTLRQKEKALNKYITFISRELGKSMRFSMIQDDQGHYTLTLSALGADDPTPLSVFNWTLSVIAVTTPSLILKQPYGSIVTAALSALNLKDRLSISYSRHNWHLLIGSYRHMT